MNLDEAYILSHRFWSNMVLYQAFRSETRLRNALEPKGHWLWKATGWLPGGWTPIDD